MSTPPQHPGQPPQFGPPQGPPGAQPVPPQHGAPAPQFGPPPAYGYPGAPQPAQPAPPYGQQPYGQQPPTYGPPPQYGSPTYGPPPDPVPAEPTPGTGRKAKLKIVGAVLGGLALIVGYFVSGPSGSSAKVGDCVKATGTRDVEIVKCTDSQANYKVVAKYNDTTDTARCRQTTGSTSAVSGKSGRRWNKKRYVLCLGPLTTGTGVPPVKKS
ncbi:hypothetical protein [Kitasatospora sp. NPDC088351]|uniref:LppU/SCO3897 family protein n=1 Tax=unclassified Kitasatospora TaxID=2633591 RepID=UPI00343AC53F